MDWKAILALAVFVAPLAYCELSVQQARYDVKIACIENDGRWTAWHGGTCVADK